jgi:CHAT domain-containing protein/Tfp pilus assembly protein PilF
MTQPLFLRSVQSRFLSLIRYRGLMLSIVLPFVQIQASPSMLCASLVSQAQEDQHARQLEPGKPIERDLAGGQSHSYQLTLDAGQYVKLVVDQRGVDVVVHLSGPDGRQFMEFDSESRSRGKEIVEQVAEAAGSYRLTVQSKQKGTPAGGYEIRVEEVRTATANDRDLHKARELYKRSLNLIRSDTYNEALRLLEQVLEIREKLLGSDHPDFSRALNAMANVYSRRGEYAKAEPLYYRALAVREKSLGPEHPDTALTLNNLGLRCLERSDYAKAELFFQRALAILEKTLGPEHSLVSVVLYNLAILSRERGDEAKAELLYERALTIREKMQGPEHPDVAGPLNGLALLHKGRGDYAKAELLLQRARAIWEKALGPDNVLFGQSLHNLADIYREMGEYAKAEPLGRQALVILERKLGPKHPFVIIALNNLANIYRDNGEYARAEPLYQRAIAIAEITVGPEHLNISSSLAFLARLYATKGDIAQAITFQSRANTVVERNFSLNLASGSERQKLAYLAVFSNDTDFTLSLHSQAAPDDPQALNLAFTTLLRRKGRGLDAMTDTIATLRRRATPQDLMLLDQLAEARSQLAALTLKDSGAVNPDAYRASLRLLEEKVENLEADLSARSVEFRAQSQPATLAAIQAALPSGSALIECAVHTPQELRTRKNKPPRYLAYLLTAQGQPKWVDLGEAAPIDRTVDDWRESLRNPNRPDVKRLARELDDKIMRPVRFLLRQMPLPTRHLLIAPDGSLNLIPFAALVDEQYRYLVERYSISYLTSGRDLLRLQTTQPSKSAPLVVANPDFDRVDTVAVRGVQNPGRSQEDNRGAPQSYITDVSFPPLPGTKAEALAVKAALPDASLLLQEQATETALKQAKAPRFLHIATHGFFLSNQEALPAKTRGVLGDDPLRISDLRLSKWAAYIKDPLLRSGLALAGANQGRSRDDDGLLTALEVAGLDLWGTKLVVLSACDTGVGEVRNGEGVQGLRRALVLAGSESQMMSLWPVLDRRTKDLMIPYYKALRRGEGRSEALRQVQLQMLRSKYERHPFHWAAFILSGEWRNLNGQEGERKGKNQR